MVCFLAAEQHCGSGQAAQSMRRLCRRCWGSLPALPAQLTWQAFATGFQSIAAASLALRGHFWAAAPVASTRKAPRARSTGARIVLGVVLGLAVVRAGSAAA